MHGSADWDISFCDPVRDCLENITGVEAFNCCQKNLGTPSKNRWNLCASCPRIGKIPLNIF